MLAALVALILVLPLVLGAVALRQARVGRSEGRAFRPTKAPTFAVVLAVFALVAFGIDVSRGMEILPLLLLLLLWGIPIAAVAWCPWIALALPLAWIAGGGIPGEARWSWMRVDHYEATSPEDGSGVRLHPSHYWADDRHSLLHPLRVERRLDRPTFLVVEVEGVPPRTFATVHRPQVVSDGKPPRRSHLVLPDASDSYPNAPCRTQLWQDDGFRWPYARLIHLGPPLGREAELEVEVDVEAPQGKERRRGVVLFRLHRHRTLAWGGEDG